MQRSLVTAFAVLASAAMAVPASACGFEDPNSAPMQRVMLNLVYPDALYVQGAVDTALRAGVIRPEHFTRTGDFFALQRTTRNLRRFAEGLADGVAPDLPAFSLVMMGPVLWTRFHAGSDGFVAETHAIGPLTEGVVMVTDVPAMAALVSGDVSGADANASGLVRYYGDSAEVDRLREALAQSFPIGAGQVTRDQARKALPAAR